MMMVGARFNIFMWFSGVHDFEGLFFRRKFLSGLLGVLIGISSLC